MSPLWSIITRYYGSDWAGMVFMCIAIYQLGSLKRSGFLFGIAGCVGWFIFGILTQSIPDLIAQCIVIGMHIRGYLHWNTSTPT